MQCKQCGHEQQGGHFCGHCGSPLADNGTAKRLVPYERKDETYIIICAVLYFILSSSFSLQWKF